MFTKKDINPLQQNAFYPATFIYPFQVQVTLQAQSFYIELKGKQHTQQNQPGLLMQQWMVILYHKYLYT